MRLTEFHQLLEDEFGRAQARFLAHSHVLVSSGRTPEQLIEDGVDLRKVWLELCDDFDVPEGRRLGRDDLDR
ncbi:DUF3046 domain-containing protein [Corynebacterium hylobatis]|uniref:DUF3046 domain-containing protein n=1 Tax=Corynebacterium hylobatis TaxID=1859290 RepID=A0A3S0HFT3_9CORY|nr:DUF3046 domain-containing protein [Corynebacterium hylobatis]RSZ61726.1 DUF3046 domain-containing protein [Corynebacterium hylobatis]